MKYTENTKFGNTDHLQQGKQLKEKSVEYNRTLLLEIVNFDESFDCVELDSVTDAPKWKYLPKYYWK